MRSVKKIGKQQKMNGKLQKKYCKIQNTKQLTTFHTSKSSKINFRAVRKETNKTTTKERCSLQILT